jgi:hypothetical protein
VPDQGLPFGAVVDDAAESFVVGVVVAPDDAPADHAGLLLVGDVVGAVDRHGSGIHALLIRVVTVSEDFECRRIQ